MVNFYFFFLFFDNLKFLNGFFVMQNSSIFTLKRGLINFIIKKLIFGFKILFFEIFKYNKKK